MTGTRTSPLPAPLLERNRLVASVAVARRERKKIVLANGCFDLLHIGHVRYLAGAREAGDFLVVAINSDEQVRKLKGPGRPCMGESDRADVVAAIRFVDVVTIFPEPTVEELIRAIRPDLHAKGPDYTVDTVPERDVVIECGGQVVIVGDETGHSTTGIIESITRKA